jgi:hypothetical protein
MRRKVGVGVQEKQSFAGRNRRSSVHLPRAPARRMDHPVGERHRDRRRRIGATAIDDDDLVASGAQRRERVERRSNSRGFVERRNNDRELHFLASFSDQSYSRCEIAALPSATILCCAGSSESSFAYFPKYCSRDWMPW